MGPATGFCEHKMNIYIHLKVGDFWTAKQLFALAGRAVIYTG